MSIFKRNLLATLPVLGMLALATACGGGDDAADTAATGDSVAAPADAPAAPAATGTVHEVQMLTSADLASGTFEPANLTVKQGDRIRFTTDGKAAHNVSFPPADNAGAANLPPAGAFLTTAGQTHEVDVTMGPGSYVFVCDPHVAMGMRGTLTVQ
ncbi:MAG TPA: plastocyanin/azurin family copper-binding protein [Longimicrobiaceae bacterium]|nr:plastocyanin/azurin family copper-binding protein [Longimicrobiaceae bacterium]